MTLKIKPHAISQDDGVFVFPGVDIGTARVSSLTATRLVAADGAKSLVSASLADWVTGTANQITVTDGGDGTITLSTPQDIHTGATPTFAGLTVNGSTSLDGAVVINEGGAAVATRIEGSSEPNLLYIHPDGQICIGTDDPYYGPYGLEIVATDEAPKITLRGFKDAVDTPGGAFFGQLARGTPGSPSAVQTNDVLFYIDARGYTGTTFGVGARVYFIAEGNWSSTSYPTKITFSTTPSGSTSMVPRVTISNDGAITTYPDVGSTFVINENGVDADFRVEGDTEPNLLFVDAEKNRVGVGTPAPVMRFEVVEDTDRYPARIRSSSGTFTHTLIFGDVEAPASANFNLLELRTDVGTAAVTKFKVAGDGGIFMYSLLSAGASTDVHINASSELIRVTSSRRFKKAIKPLEARFDSSLIYDLDPVSFVWRKNTGNPDMVDFGIIAEDAYEIMPELVNLDEEGKPFSMRYSMISVMLLAEVQKLNARLTSLENRVN